MAATPAATKIVLSATLGLTLAAVVYYARVAEEQSASGAGRYLLLFGMLFVVRVAGQLVVLARAPSWLPPMEAWNLLPYRLLLPIQLAMVAVMGAIVADFLLGPWFFAEPRSAFGVVIAFSFVYAASMVVRYIVRMTRKPEERWFGGTIPIVFHVVLASFLFVFGLYHALH